jgi:hypothetical protein
MDDPGGPAPRDAALPETHDAYTQSDLSYPRDLYAFADERLSLSDSKSFIDGPAAASAGNRVHYDRGSTLRNPRASLAELPNELLVYIFELADDGKDRSSLTRLSRTSKNLKAPADELLYKAIQITDDSFSKISATLEENANLAALVRSVVLEFISKDVQDRGTTLQKLLDIVPNIQSLTLEIRWSYHDLVSDHAMRGLKNKLWIYPTLKELTLSISISLTVLRTFLSLPFLETLNCYLLDGVSPPESWEVLVPKSKVRHLEVSGLDDFEMISRVLSSIESLKHLGMHEWMGGKMDDPVSWDGIKPGLATHKDSLESLEIIHTGSVDFRSLDTFRDFPRLRVLTLSLHYGEHLQTEEPSLTGMLPEGLHELSILIWPSWPIEETAPSYYKEILGLKDHNHLRFVKIDVQSKLTVSSTGVRLSTVVETLQRSGIRVEVWRDGAENMTPVISSLQDWEDQSDSEDSEEDDMLEIVPFDHEHDDTSSGADSDED